MAPLLFMAVLNAPFVFAHGKAKEPSRRYVVG